MRQVSILILSSLILLSLVQQTTATEQYAIVSPGGGSEGNLNWNCTVNYCAISSFAPQGDGDCPICGTPTYWDSTSLPLGAYYWLGSVSVLECQSDQWVAITTTPGWYFNYNPLVGDQSAVAGEPCSGGSSEANDDPGKPCPMESVGQ